MHAGNINHVFCESVLHNMVHRVRTNGVKAERHENSFNTFLPFVPHGIIEKKRRKSAKDRKRD